MKRFSIKTGLLVTAIIAACLGLYRVAPFLTLCICLLALPISFMACIGWRRELCKSWKVRLGLLFSCMLLYFGMLGPLGAAFMNMPQEWKHKLTPAYRASGLPAGYVLENCAPLQSMLASYFSEWRKPFEEVEEVFVEAEKPFVPTPET